MRTLLILILSAVHAFSATIYYVDFSSGDNANNGTSAATPFRHCPGSRNATGNALATYTTLASGDTIRFKGGVEYSGGTTQFKAGVTYDGTGDNYGTGRAILNGLNAGGGGFTTSNASGTHQRIDNFVFKGFEIKRIGGYPDDSPVLSGQCSNPSGANYMVVTAPPGGTAITIKAGSSGWLLQDLLIYECGQWRNQQPFSGVNSVTGTGIDLEDVKNFTILNVYATKMRTPLSLKISGSDFAANGYIENFEANGFYVWGLDMAPRGSNLSYGFFNITFKRCKWKNICEYDRGNWLGCGEKPHTDMVFARTAKYDCKWENVLFDSCEFSTDPEDVRLTQGGTGSFFSSEGSSFKVINSTIFLNKGANEFRVGYGNQTGAPQLVEFYHNLFVTTKPMVSVGRNWQANSSGVMTQRTAPETRTVIAKNNIYIIAGTGSTSGRNQYPSVSAGDTTTFVTTGNNIYWRYGGQSTTQKIFTLDDSSNTYTLAELQALGKGWETGSFIADPQFEYLDGNDHRLFDLRLKSTSPAIGAGEDVGVYYDKNGNVRTPGSIDIGPFQFSAPVEEPPDAPATFTATAASTTQIDLVWENVTTETGYELQRKTGIGGTYAALTTSAINSTTYSATGLSAATEYYFRIRATNSYGESAWVEANATTDAVTDVAPSITAHPQSQSKFVGQSVTFTATASGSPTPTYQWYKEGTGAISGATSTSLTLSNLQDSNAGNYYVIATNSQGDAQSNSATLTVLQVQQSETPIPARPIKDKRR